MKAQSAKADPESAPSAVRLPRGPGHVATFRNSRGEALEPSSVSASQAKSEFGRVLELAIQGGAVVITKHDAPRAVLISVENFNAFWQKAGDPKEMGEIVFQRRAPHCWGPRAPELLDKMTKQIDRYAPSGADKASWRYK